MDEIQCRGRMPPLPPTRSSCRSSRARRSVLYESLAKLRSSIPSVLENAEQSRFQQIQGGNLGSKGKQIVNQFPGEPGWKIVLPQCRRQDLTAPEFKNINNVCLFQVHIYDLGLFECMYNCVLVILCTI